MGECGHEDGPVATAKLRHAQCTLPLAEGYLVADSISVRLVSDDGIVTTLAGGDEEGFADGVGAAARFNYITGVAPHPDGGWVVCDSGNYRIRRVLRDGTVSTLAGSDEVVDDDGAGAVASFVDMDGIAPHPEGGWLVVDDCMLRRVLLDGTVSTFAGGAKPVSQTVWASQLDSQVSAVSRRTQTVAGSSPTMATIGCAGYCSTVPSRRSRAQERAQAGTGSARTPASKTWTVLPSMARGMPSSSSTKRCEW